MRHGQVQKNNALAGKFTLQAQSAKKKMANLSIPRLRVMFPQYMALSDTELVNTLRREGRL
jgi:hypothetical protein